MGGNKGKRGKTHQSMRLRLLKIITPIQRIKPRIQEELRPVPVLEHKTPRTQSLSVLRQHQIDSIAVQVSECFDHAVGRDDGIITQHELFEHFGREEVCAEVEGGVHD